MPDVWRLIVAIRSDIAALKKGLVGRNALIVVAADKTWQAVGGTKTGVANVTQSA
jgi:hypothetical protein